MHNTLSLFGMRVSGPKHVRYLGGDMQKGFGLGGIGHDLHAWMTGINAAANGSMHRNTPEEGECGGFHGPCALAAAEDFNGLSAMGTVQQAHVLDDAHDGDTGLRLASRAGAGPAGWRWTGDARLTGQTLFFPPLILDTPGRHRSGASWSVARVPVVGQSLPSCWDTRQAYPCHRGYDTVAGERRKGARRAAKIAGTLPVDGLQAGRREYP